MGEHVPKKFEDFLKIKYNDAEGYGKLKHAYRVANQYEHNSGNMDPMKIVELHDEAVLCKARFTGKARKGANMGIMEIDGKIYIANSHVNKTTDPAYVNYKGEKEQIVLKTEQPRFHPFQVGNHPGEVDSECKLFEFASTIADDGEKHSIKMLSERCMCSSCQSVMAEFKKRHPNIDVEVVSHKSDKADRNRNKNPIFKKDVELRYKSENS